MTVSVSGAKILGWKKGPAEQIQAAPVSIAAKVQATMLAGGFGARKRSELMARDLFGGQLGTR